MQLVDVVVVVVVAVHGEALVGTADAILVGCGTSTFFSASSKIVYMWSFGNDCVTLALGTCDHRVKCQQIGADGARVAVEAEVEAKVEEEALTLAAPQMTTSTSSSTQHKTCT